jgi:hypothetical protein
MALTLKDVEKKKAKRVPTEKQSAPTAQAQVELPLNAATKPARAKKAKSAKSKKSPGGAADTAAAGAQPSRRRKSSATPWVSVGAPAQSPAEAKPVTVSISGEHSEAQSATDRSSDAEVKFDKDTRSKTMKEQGIQLLKKAIGVALDKKQEVVSSSTFQSLYGISKAQVQAQLAKYPKIQTELNTRIEKLGVCEKAEMVENMLREFAKGEITVNPS